MKSSCATCGTEIQVRPSQFKESGNYCSRACWYTAQAPRPSRRKGSEKPCEVCGKLFYLRATRPDSRFCGLTCKGIASRKSFACEVCGKVVEIGFRSRTKRWCSRECADIGRRKGEYHPCAVCGKQVYIPPGRLGQTRYFCSQTHANEWQGRGKTTHACKICAKVFRWSPSRSRAYNITYCSLACRDADPERRAMLIEMNAKQQSMRPNRVERHGYEILDTLGIAYERQYVIGGKFCVDAFVPSHGLVIQFDGDYWHGNPSKFPEPGDRQRKRVSLDRSQDAYMAACGYAVARIWASDLERNSEAVTARLRALLTPQEHTRAAQA